MKWHFTGGGLRRGENFDGVEFWYEATWTADDGRTVFATGRDMLEAQARCRAQIHRLTYPEKYPPRVETTDPDIPF